MQKDFVLSVCSFNKDSTFSDVEEKVLHPQEQEKIKKSVMKRKSEFVAGRFCAKKAYLKLEEKSCSLSSLRLFNDSFGAPFFSDGGVFVSLAHDSSLAAAIVSKKETLKVGIDLEEMSPKNSEIIFKYINEPEKNLVREYEEKFGFDFLCAAIWVARESMSKLLGLGFSAFSVLEVSGFENAEVFTVKFKNFKNFGTALRIYENHVFGFSTNEKKIVEFSKENLKINLENI